MLVDDFGRTIDYLRISVTDRCDLRCNYCIPKGYHDFESHENWLTFDELTRVVSAFARLGTRHFRLTGGEPLLRKNFPILVKQLSQIDGVDDLSITTNGTQLANQADALYRAGVNRLNVSLDSIRRECVEKITGSDCLDQVLNGLKIAKDVGFKRIRINMVPIPGQNLQDIEHMIQFCIQHDFILCLIEVMPMGNTGQQTKNIDLQFILKDLEKKYALLPIHEPIGNGPARYWQSAKNVHFKLGLITPLSRHFCETCNRVRLSVDGTLYMCLGQNDKMALQPLLRANCSDAELENAICQAIKLKPKSHEFIEKPCQINRIMAATGG